jgi:hypothetical protein
MKCCESVSQGEHTFLTFLLTAALCLYSFSVSIVDKRALQLCSVPLDVTHSLQTLREVLSSSNYTARALENSRRLLVLYLAGQTSVGESSANLTVMKLGGVRIKPPYIRCFSKLGAPASRSLQFRISE